MLLEQELFIVFKNRTFWLNDRFFAGLPRIKRPYLPHNKNRISGRVWKREGIFLTHTNVT